MVKKEISDGHGDITICIWDVSDGILTLIYVFLLIWCIRLIYEHRSSWTSGQAHGLIWYLVCTTLLCIFRSIGFSMVPFADTECDHRYKSWQWEVDGSSDGSKFFDFCLIVLSTASSALFFTSYTYFAHSLAKVLDMLTSDNVSNSSKSETRFLIVLLGLNICVWLSIGTLWIATLFDFSIKNFVDNLAQVSIAFAALTTCTIFNIHFVRASCFLRRNFGRDIERAAQLERLFKLKRVVGVCRVCTLCFALRAFLLLTRASLGPMLEDLYFLFSEALPTAYILYAFKSSENKATINTTNNSNNNNINPYQAQAEFEILKASLTNSNNVMLLHGSPIRLGLTRGFYQTPEKNSHNFNKNYDNNDDIEENVRLLATPHGDPLIDDQTKDFYML